MALELKDVKYFSCHDFMRYVKETYGKDIDIVSNHAEHTGQDTFVEIDVNTNNPDDGWWPSDNEMWENPDKALQAWLDGDDTINANENLILWDMCRKGIIFPGKYVTKIWW
jgi:hypothetical protein